MSTRFHPICRGLSLALLFAASSLAAQTSLSVGTVPGYPGTAVPVPVTLRQTLDRAVAAQFDVTFNTGKVSALPAMRGERLTNHVIRSREIAPGVERVLIYSLNNFEVAGTNATIARAPFAIAPAEYVGSGPLTPANVLLSRRDATALAPASASAGAIFVRPVNRRPDGVVDFFLASEPDKLYLIQATTNFAEWVNISTNLAQDSFMALVDEDARNFPHRFYRSALFDALQRGFLGAVARPTNGAFIFRITGLQDRAYTVQASTNLVHWENLATLTAAAGAIQFTNIIAPSFPSRFFRLQSGP